MKTYQVRGYWHSNGADFQAMFSEAPNPDAMHVMDKSELLSLLKEKVYGHSFYIDADVTYKKSFTITAVAKEYDNEI